MNPELLSAPSTGRWAHSPAAMSSPDGLTIGALVRADGSPTALARDLHDERIRIRGYVAPSLIAAPGRVLLTEASLAPCQLCGNIHGTMVGLQVQPETPIDTDIAMHQPVEVVGRLFVGTGENETREIGLRLARIVRVRSLDAEIGSARRWLRRALDARPHAKPHQRPIRPAPSVTAVGPAEVILTNGKIRTVDAAFTTAEAVAVRDGQFIAVGRAEEVELIHSQAYKADKSKKYRVVAYTSRDIHELYGVDVVPAVNVSYSNKLEARPAAFKEFNRMLKESVDYAVANPRKVGAAISKEHNISPDFFQAWLTRFSFFPATVSKADGKAFETVWQGAKELGILKSYPKAESVIWEHAIRE